MGNYPYPSDYILNDQGLLPPFPMTAACAPMANASAAFRSDPTALLTGLRESVAVYYNYSLGRKGPQPTCYNIHAGVNNASAMVDFLWGFQYCSEIFQIASRNGKSDMFFNQKWNPELQSSTCKGNPAYGGVVPRQDFFTTWVGATPAAAVSNVVFSNGKLDPWSRQGVLPPSTCSADELGVTAADIGDGSLALLIDKSAHHLDLFFANPQDPPSVVAARKQEMALVAKWIAEKKARAEAEAVNNVDDGSGEDACGV